MPQETPVQLDTAQSIHDNIESYQHSDLPFDPNSPRAETPYRRRNTNLGDAEVLNHYQMIQIICSFVHALTKNSQNNYDQRRQTIEQHISYSDILKDKRFAQAAFSLGAGGAEALSEVFFKGQDFSGISNPLVWGSCKVAEYAPKILNTASKPYFDMQIDHTQSKRELVVNEGHALKSADERILQLLQQFFQHGREALQTDAATKSSR